MNCICVSCAVKIMKFMLYALCVIFRICWIIFTNAYAKYVFVIGIAHNTHISKRTHKYPGRSKITLLRQRTSVQTPITKFLCLSHYIFFCALSSPHSFHWRKMNRKKIGKMDFFLPLYVFLFVLNFSLHSPCATNRQEFEIEM